MDFYRNIIKKKEISKNLEYKISVSIDEQFKILTIDYMQGKFSVEKTFKNNLKGNDELESTLGLLNTEEKVKKYLNL